MYIRYCLRLHVTPFRGRGARNFVEFLIKLEINLRLREILTVIPPSLSSLSLFLSLGRIKTWTYLRNIKYCRVTFL